MTDENSQLYVVSDEFDGFRLDKALSEMVDGLSRTRIKNCIEDKGVLVNGICILSPKHKICSGDEIILNMPKVKDYEPEGENINLDIIYEDEHMLVINKAAGMVVHQGAGNYTGTLVNALIYHCKDELSGIGGIKRPGIVHRLDKETSGLMVVAKNDFAHMKLSSQLEDRSLFRLYHGVVLNVPLPVIGRIDAPIGRHSVHRTKMSIRGQNYKNAATNYRVIKKAGESFSLVECKLETGRTHQIRVHMEYIKNPMIGDPLYGPQITAVKSALNKIDADDEVKDIVLNFPRQALHAREIAFIHPVTEEKMHFVGEYPESFKLLINNLF